MLTLWANSLHNNICICMFLVACISYLCPGSRFLCTHWDTHRKERQYHGTFLRSDRREDSLQWKYKHMNVQAVRAFFDQL